VASCTLGNDAQLTARPDTSIGHWQCIPGSGQELDTLICWDHQLIYHPVEALNVRLIELESADVNGPKEYQK